VPQITIPISITSHSGDPTSGEVIVEEYTPGQRRRRALKILAVWWGLAILFIPVPPIHFVVVPLFLVCGPIFATFARRQYSKIISGSAICPLCKKSFEVVKNTPRWPMDDVCTNCHQHVEITAKSP
jgi:hypothetical protein